MREAVVAELVSAGDDLPDRVGVQLAVDRLDEERRDQAALVELVEQPGERFGDRRVAAELGVGRQLAALERGRLAEVVERKHDRARRWLQFGSVHPAIVLFRPCPLLEWRWSRAVRAGSAARSSPRWRPPDVGWRRATSSRTQPARGRWPSDST